MAEHEVLVELHPALGVQVDMEQLAVVQRLRNSRREVQPGHLLVPDLGIDPDQLGMLQGFDEGERMAECGQQDVAPRLVRLRFDGEADSVSLVDHIVAEQVDGFAVAFERTADVLGHVVLRTLPPTPHHEGFRAQFGGKVEVAEHLADREAAHGPVVAGEAAVLEHRMAEQVGGNHRDDETGVGERLLQAIDFMPAGGIRAAEREQVVVVKGESVCAELGQFVHGFDGVEVSTGCAAELVLGGPADGPQAEGELVVAGGHDCHGRSISQVMRGPVVASGRDGGLAPSTADGKALLQEHRDHDDDSFGDGLHRGG